MFGCFLDERSNGVRKDIKAYDDSKGGGFLAVVVVRIFILLITVLNDVSDLGTSMWHISQMTCQLIESIGNRKEVGRFSEFPLVSMGGIMVKHLTVFLFVIAILAG